MKFPQTLLLALFTVGMSCGMPHAVQAQLHFDASNAAGLTPAPSPVNWAGSFWQSSDTPGTGSPGAWIDGSIANFETGGINLVNISGTITIAGFGQSVAGTATSVGGSGSLILAGSSVTNNSGQDLRFLKGLTVILQTSGTSYQWEAMSGNIIVNSVISGAGGIEKKGAGTLYLNTANSYTGNTTLTAGITEAGSAAAFGPGKVIFNGGTLRYAAGVTEDFSDQFNPIAGAAVIDTNGGNITFNSVLTGSSSITKTGAGRLVLNAASPAFSGQIIVNEGTLAINPSTVASVTTATIFGTSSGNAADGVLVKNGATLDLSGGGTANEPFFEYIELEGRGVNGQGAMIKNSGQNQSLRNVYLTGHATINVNSRVDLDGIFDANGFSLTKLGSGELPLEGGAGSRELGNAYVKQGTLNFTGSSDMGYDTSLTFGNTIFVNTGGVLQTYEKTSDAKRITLNGGTLRRGGGSVSTTVTTVDITGGITLNAGASSIARNSTTHGQRWGLNTINRNLGATVDHDALSTSLALATTDTRNTNGILGGYFSFGGTTWAVNSTNADDGVIAGLGEGSYQTSAAPTDWLATDNVSLAGNPGGNVTGRTINSLRLTAASALTIQTGDTLTLASGGLLVTGTGATSISGGSIQSGNGQDLIILQNASQTLTISSVIKDNGAAKALTKSGVGVLILAGINTYSGGTYINGGNNSGTLATGVLEVSNISASGADNLGDNSAGNDLYFNNGTLRYANGVSSATLARDVNLLSGGGVFEVTAAGIILEIAGKISGETLAEDEGFYSGQGTLTKTGAGVLVISNSANDYTGGTTINGGIVRMSGAGKLGASIGCLTVNNTGILDLNGTSQNVGLLAGSAGGIIRNNGNGNQTLTVGNGNASSVTSVSTAGSAGYAGIIQDNDGTASGTVSLVKVGTGTQIISGVNTYTGTTSVNEGTLQVGSGTGTGTSTAKTGAGSLSVAAHAILSGNGVIGGNAVVASGGLISVGNFGQTAAQTLTFSGSLTSNGTISLDVWTASSVDQIRFTVDKPVDLNGSLVVNNTGVPTYGWQTNEALKLFDWGATSISNRDIGDLLLDIGALKLANSANTYWDTSRLLVDGTIVVLANAIAWDASTGTPGAQDGAGTWAVTPNNSWWNGSANVSFVSDGTQNVIFGSGSGAAGTVTVNNTGGILVNNITFNAAGSGYYTLAGTGATGTVTLSNNAWITTNHGYVDSLGTTISAVIAGTNWTKSGDGRLILAGTVDNTFTGNVTVAQGVLDIRHGGALSNTTGNTSVLSGATLEVRGGITVAENLVLNGSGYQSGVNAIGALRNQTGNNTFSGTISLPTTAQITSATGTLSLSGVVSGAGALVVTGEDATATVQFSGSAANTYTGGTYINSGILRLAKSQFVNAIAANTQVYIGDGIGTVRDILRLGQHDQISDTGTVLNFKGTGASAGVFQLSGFNETVGTIRSSNGEGIIENGGSGTSTLTINNATNDTFSGILQNGTGILALTKINNGILTLTGANTYTGDTTLRAGVLELAGAGALANTGALNISIGGTFRISNTAAANSGNRLNNNAAISMNGGRIEFNNDAGAASFSEAAGALNLQSGANTISSSQAAAGRSSSLGFASLNRSGYATLDFSGVGLGTDSRNQITFVALSRGIDHGMMGAWATVGNNFAKYGSLGVTAMTDADYVSNTADSAWKFDQNIKQKASVTLGGSRVVNSLNLAQESASTLDLGGNTLRVESGGLMVSGDFDSAITNGVLTAGTSTDSAGELVIHQNSTGKTMTISASIGNNGSGEVSVTKSGAGILVLAGANTFTGGLTLNAGTLKLASAGALADGSRLTVEGGAFDLNGQSIVVGQLQSALTATGAVITNNGMALSTLTVGSGDASSAFYGSLQNGTGVLAVTKTGLGATVLGGNNTFTGVVNVDAGKLVVGNANALGATGASSGTVVKNGATLEFAAEGTYNETISIIGEGVNRQGALTLANTAALRGAPDQVKVMNLVLAGNATINTNNKRLDLDGALQGGGFALTKTGSAQMTYEGGQTTNLGDVFIKQGDFTFGGGTGALGDSSKTVYVNTGAIFRFYNVSAVSKNVTLRGGLWDRNGSSSPVTPLVFRVTNGLKLEAGASSITHTATNQIIHLGAVQRDVGATLNITNTSTVPFTTNTLNTNGIIGGYFTWGGNTWATSAASGTDITIAGFTGYQTNNFTVAANNVDVTSSQSPVAGSTVNSLRFNTAGAVTLTLQGVNTVSSGGILVTSTVAGNVNKITGGTLVGAAGANGDLIVHQNNAGSDFTIESVIANNGADNTALTKTGVGRLVLSGNNTYSGGTYIHGAVGGGTRGILAVSTISDTGDSNLGNSTGGSNGLFFNNGILEYTGAGNVQTGRNVQLLSGGGEFRVSASGVELDLNGVVSSPDNENNDGFYAGEGTLTKSGNGTLVLSGTAANTYTGDTIINAGVLLLNKTVDVNAVLGNITINATGILRLAQSNQINNSSVVTLAGSGAFDLNGKSETLGGLSGVDAASEVRNGSSTASKLTLEVAAGQTAKYSGKIIDGTGKVALEKKGAGTQVLIGNNSYTGDTTVSEGILQIGDGGAAAGLNSSGNIAIANNAQLVVNTTSAVDFAQTIAGAGTFVQAGPGVTTISGSGWMKNSGGTRVTAGALIYNSSYEGLDGGPVVVSGGTLGGSGMVNARVVVKESGRINAGDNDVNVFGRLTINGELELKRGASSADPKIVFQVDNMVGSIYNDVNLNPGLGGSAYGNLPQYLGQLDFSNIDGEGQSLQDLNIGAYDQLVLKGQMKLEAGALILLDNSKGYVFQAGDMLDLFDWNSVTNPVIVGDWNLDVDLVLPTLGAGLTWDRSLFLSEGVVVVVAPEPGRMLLMLIGVGAALASRRRRKTSI